MLDAISVGQSVRAKKHKLGWNPSIILCIYDAFSKGCMCLTENPRHCCMLKAWRHWRNQYEFVWIAWLLEWKRQFCRLLPLFGLEASGENKGCHLPSPWCKSHNRGPHWNTQPVPLPRPHLLLWMHPNCPCENLWKLKTQAGAILIFHNKNSNNNNKKKTLTTKKSYHQLSHFPFRWSH